MCQQSALIIANKFFLETELENKETWLNHIPLELTGFWLADFPGFRPMPDYCDPVDVAVLAGTESQIKKDHSAGLTIVPPDRDFPGST